MSDQSSPRGRKRREHWRGNAITDLLRAAIVSQAGPSDLARSRLLTPAEAGAYLGIGVDALWWWRRHGKGPPFYRLGDWRSVRYRATDLDEWLETRRFAGGPK